MAMGLMFGYVAIGDIIFTLVVQRAYGVMSNDVLIAVPLFLFMGYIVERANILDRLFHSIQVAARNVAASLAGASLVTCAMFATATSLLGWPLEWTEIIIIFVPIFLPLRAVFGVDPLYFGVLVALNIQTSFLTPPMAMWAFYLKGTAPHSVEFMNIFRGIMPFLFMVLVAMVILYNVPQMVFWLPHLLYN